MPTDQNQSDLGSPGTVPANLGEFWLKGTTYGCVTRPSGHKKTDVAFTRKTLLESIPKPLEKMLLEQNGDESNDKEAWKSFLVKNM